MILRRIVLDNIRSYEHEEIDFPQGSILLAGDVGSGKTSVLLGIEFGLFGLQPGQRGTALLRNDKQEGGVRIEFEVGGKQVLIERNLKRKKSVSQEYCSITVDGEKEEISVTELKNRVLTLLNYPLEFSKKQNILYRFTVYTPQEEMKQIILENTDKRLDTLRHIFGIDKYKKILENIMIIKSKVREERKINEAVVENFEEDEINLVSKEDEVETKKQNFISVEREFMYKKDERRNIEEEKDEIYKKIEEKNRLQQEIEKTKIIISNKNETIIENVKAIKQLEEEIEKLRELKVDEKKISNLEREVSFLKNEKEEINKKNLRINSNINSFVSKNEENKKLEKRFSDLEICPTCLQDVDAVYRANVLNKIRSGITETNRKIKELEEEKEKVSEELEKINFWILNKEKELSNLRISKIKYQDIDNKQRKINEIEKLNERIEKDTEILEEHNEKLKNSVFDLSQFENLFEEKKRNLTKALEEERNAEIKLAELRKEIDVFSNQITELRKKVEKAKKIRKKVNYLSKLENWLSKDFTSLVSLIEKNVMNKLKKEFSKLFEKWFSMLVSGPLNVQLHDDFTPVIEQQDYEIDYEYLSGGERTAIALAYRLSLNQVINSLLSKIKTHDLVILDEPTDGFSDQQLDKMRDVLQELNVAQLILVSHEQKIEGFVDNVIRFRKEKGISRIET